MFSTLTLTLNKQNFCERLHCVAKRPCRSVDLPWWCTRSKRRRPPQCHRDLDSDRAGVWRKVDLKRELKLWFNYLGHGLSYGLRAVTMCSVRNRSANFGFTTEILSSTTFPSWLVAVHFKLTSLPSSSSSGFRLDPSQALVELFHAIQGRWEEECKKVFDSVAKKKITKTGSSTSHFS